MTSASIFYLIGSISVAIALALIGMLALWVSTVGSYRSSLRPTFREDRAQVARSLYHAKAMLQAYLFDQPSVSAKELSIIQICGVYIIRLRKAGQVDQYLEVIPNENPFRKAASTSPPQAPTPVTEYQPVLHKARSVKARRLTGKS